MYFSEIGKIFQSTRTVWLAMTVNEIFWNRKNHFGLHHHITMNLDVGLKKIRLILFEDCLVLLLCLDCPWLRWMFFRSWSPPEILTIGSAIDNVKISSVIDVNTSFTLSLRTWSSDTSISSNSSMSATIMSPFQISFADNTHPRNILDKTLGQIDAGSICLQQK